MTAKSLVWILAAVLTLSFVLAQDIDYFTDRMNFPPGESRTHQITVTNNGNTAVTVNVTVPSGFSATGVGTCSYPSPGTYSCLVLPNTTENAEIYSPGSCAEGTIYYSTLTDGGNFSERLVFVCIPDNKVVDHKVEYGHGCSDYLTESCISTETATLFNLLRIWNIGNYLDPDEDATDAKITCYYENYPVRTYGRTEINYTPAITGDFLWELIEGGYWFRIGVVSQDVSGKVPGDSYSVNCTQLSYRFKHEQVIARFQNYSLDVVSPNPFIVTSQNYTADPSKFIFTIKNNQSCSVYDIYFTRSIEGYTKTEYIPKLDPGKEINYIGDNTNASSLIINYIPSWHANSLCPSIYTQTATVSGIINNPPLITSATPSGNVTINISQTQQLSITYTDLDSDILTVRWYINGSLVSTGTDTPPYEASYYNFTNATTGTYEIKAMVFDPYSSDSHIWIITVNQSGFCGDAVCGPGENCSNCPIDCGVCIPTCGNGTCDPGENCSNCPADCGTCPAVCGNGVCESGESCSTCPTDCGSCGGGGGGGGGGGWCIINIVCDEWQPEQCPESGIQTRYCYDKYKCSTKTYTETRECPYVNSCFNAVQDNGEEGIDCGGECPPCSSCFNKVQDGAEEGIDCGGSCLPCATCSDGIQNTHILPDGTISKEQGIDCGGPCEPCVCTTCPVTEKPEEICREIIPSWQILIWILIIMILYCLLSYTYSYTKEYRIRKGKSTKGIKKIDNLIIKIKRKIKTKKSKLFAILLLAWLAFILPIIDKGCKECHILSSRLILLILILLAIILLIISMLYKRLKTNKIIIKLIIYKKKIIEMVKHRICLSYYCRRILMVMIALALIVLLYSYYSRCPAATCSDLVKNQGETGVDCGGPCSACPVTEKPADICGIPPWQINIIILWLILLAFLFDYAMHLAAQKRKKDFMLYEYFKNSHLINLIIAAMLILVLFSANLLDRQCFECRPVHSIQLLAVTISLIIIFMAYRLYSKAKGIHILNLCKHKGMRLLILLLLVIAASATLIDTYAYCPASTCTDGMQNQLETGTDCGGPCQPCAERHVNAYTIAIFLLLLLILIAIYGTNLYYRYASLKRVYNIELCPRCGTHMQRKGWLKAGIAGGKRTVYRCPRCKYSTIRNEQEINLREKMCPDCETEMTQKNIKMFGKNIGKIYTCPHCGQKRIRIRLFK